METHLSSIISIPTNLTVHNGSHDIRFTDEDIESLFQYAFDMNYRLEPDMTGTPMHLNPFRIKIISQANPEKYGWISKVAQKEDGRWQLKFLYGFYRHGRFRIKYPVTFMVCSKQMRGMIKRKTEANPRMTLYFRLLFGILDLEKEVNPLEFILSWFWSLKIKHV